MCEADDTPRYTGRVNQQASAEHPTSGVRQTRMCRDWSQLERWAVAHSGCYKAINFSDGSPPIERTSSVQMARGSGREDQKSMA